MISQNNNKKAAVLYADLEKGPLGLRSRVSDRLGGHSILHRTLTRLQRVKLLDDVFIYCPTEQINTVGQLSKGTNAVVQGITGLNMDESVIRKRKWAISSWRGGLGGATHFDEQPVSQEIVQHLSDNDIQIVLTVPAEAIFIEPPLLDEMIQHHLMHADEMRFTFAHASPGISCCLFRIDLLADLVQAGDHIGSLLAYQPDNPRSDYINHNCTLVTEPELGSCHFRFLADTQRGVQMFNKIIQEADNPGLDWGAGEVIQRVRDAGSDTEGLPRELEVEINTECSYRIKGYPHRSMQGSRPAMAIDTFKKIVSDCSAFDDICLTLGGVGEPLLHPDLAKMITLAKTRGILGINIETDGLHLCGETSEVLLQSQADTISVSLDANSAELYLSLKGEDLFESIIENMDSFIQRSKNIGGPLIIPHMVKTRSTLPEMEAFYDRWLRRCGHAVIAGFNDYCGQIDDAAVMDMSSPNRSSCRRLFRTLTILSNGKAVLCGQDISGNHVVGDVHQDSIGDIWQSKALENVRKEHLEGNYGCNKLCSKCKEWHR